MPQFSYRVTSLVLAHGKLFGKNAACNMYNIPSGTYDGWKNRLKSDKKLEELCLKELDTLINQWQGETVRTLKKGLEVTCLAFENHPFDVKPKDTREALAWAKAVDSMSKAIKSIGDLAISTTVLNDDDDGDDEL